MEKFDNENIDALYNDYVSESIEMLIRFATLEGTLAEVYRQRPKTGKKVLKEALTYTRAVTDLIADNWRNYLHAHFKS